MITRLQTFFLKHNKWLFGGLLIVIIVTFVLTIGPQSFFGSSGPQQRKSLRFYGYDLTSEADQQAMVKSAEVSAYLHPELQVRRDQLMDYAYLRVTALGIAGQIGIPNPGKEDLSGFIATLEAFKNPQTQEFSPEAYRAMVEAIEGTERYPKGFLASVFREDFLIDQVRKALSGPDYFLPFEARNAYADRETTFSVSLAHLPYEDFDPEIEVSEEALEQYFKENPARYEIPETISVTALLFQGESYLDEAPEPTEAQLETYFAANKARFQPPEQAEEEDDAEPEEPSEVTLAEVRDQVVAGWKDDQARRIAARKSEQFSVRLWQNSIALGSDEYTALIEEFSVTTVEIPPYTRNQLPRDTVASPDLLESMWVYANNPSRYFSDIGQTGDGTVLLVKNDLTQSRMPEFAEVREAVARNYRLTEKRRLFAEKGRELRETMQAGLENEEFTALAESLGLETEDLESFKGADIPQALLAATLWDQTQYLDVGEVSPMILQQERGTFSYMEEKDVPEVDTASEEYMEYVAQRSGALSNSMGWARLREITDVSLATLLEPGRD